MSDTTGSQLNSYQGPEKAVAAGPRRLIVRTCRHILETGNFCQAPATGKSAYCRAHKQLRVRMAKMAEARRQREVLKLPPLMDLQAVQVGLTKVQIALATDRIDPAHAKLLRWAMRQSATNLRFIAEQERSAARSDAPQTECRPGGVGAGTTRSRGSGS
jgi:hypothetical protein